MGFPIRLRIFSIMRLTAPARGYGKITKRSISRMATKKSGPSTKTRSPRKSAATNASGELPISITSHLPAAEAEIRRRAYELYEERGRMDGFDRDDWAQAEAEVLSRMQKKESA
jgi:hypothetical protein